VILLVRFADETEEAFEVAPTTKLASAQRNGYWRFTLTSGAQVAYAEEEVRRVELGNVTFADDRGRLEAEAPELIWLGFVLGFLFRNEMAVRRRAMGLIDLTGLNQTTSTSGIPDLDWEDPRR
jgi:hypothetical protein